MYSRIIVVLLVVPIAIENVSAGRLNYLGLEKKLCDDIGTIFCSEDCTKLLGCFQIGQEPHLVHTCNKNEDGYDYCKENDGQASCSADKPECGKSNPIKCGGVGEFPNPFIPQETVGCSLPIGSEPNNICYCTESTFVNTGTIGLPCDHNKPDYLPVECKKGGQQGQYSGNFCYICSDEGIYVYLCSVNSFVDVTLNSSFANAKTCVQVTTTTTQATGSTDPTDPTSSPTTCGTTCEREGQNIINPDGDCRSYYYCDADRNPQPRQCSTGLHFNTEYCTCAPGDC